MKQTGKIYTLYRPVMDYEESETTYAAFLTKKAAEAAKKEIVEAWRQILESLKGAGEEPYIDTFDGDEIRYENARYEHYLKTEEILKSGVLPFGLMNVYRYDIQRKSPESAVQICELPFYQ